MTDETPGGLETAALVAVGGFVGATLRYLVAVAFPGPPGTLAVNVFGSFLLGVLFYWTVHAGGVSDRLRTALGTGVLSSFTTYSTFAVQSVQSSPPALVANVLANYVLGFSGVLVARVLVRRRTARGPNQRRSSTGSAGSDADRGPSSLEGGDP